MNAPMVIRAAKIEDAIAISSVLASNLDDPGLYQKSAAAVVRALSDFFVACDAAGQIVGCAGLHRDSAQLAEIHAVAVTPQLQGKGIGQQLVLSCQQQARSRGIPRLWLATIKPAYFSRYGFQPISRWELPLPVLMRKLRQTFQQPCGRWLPALIGRHTFMLREGFD